MVGKNLFSTAALLLFAVVLSAQSNKYDGNYDVLLKSGTERFEANLNDFIKNPTIAAGEIADGYFYRFLQFKQIPDAETLQEIKAEGVILLDYVPHKTYVAAVPQRLKADKMKKWGVRSVSVLEAKHKLAPQILGPVYPEWADKGAELRLIVSYYRNLSAATVTQGLETAGVRVIAMQPNSQTAIVQVPKSEVANLALLPFLYFVEAPPAPPIAEDVLGATFHRANVINMLTPSGKHYDGSGVNILTRDDGQIGPHIDFQNRAIQTGAPATDGTHGDGVAGIMAGAGNLNPNMVGMAPGAMMYVIDYVSNLSSDNTLALHLSDNVVITNSSYSDGCNTGYTTNARVADLQSVQNPSLLHVFSAGNSNNQNCGYGAGTQWGNITGGHKIGKNVIAVANLFADGELVSSSSRGPSADGRLKPEIAANGQDQMSISTDNTYQSFGGTSGAAPGVAGVATQLYQAYREFNNGTDPTSALIKAVLMNGAEDFGNPGPDFKYGFGRVNAYRSLEMLENGDYLLAQVAQNGTNTHQITVPANVKQVKVMTYWSDAAASVNANLVLVNDLDMSLTTPTNETFLPWVLDNTPNAANLDANATRGVDNINNVEQVTLDNPQQGVYTVNVQGATVPQGSASYYVVVSYIYDAIKVVYPIGGEGFIPNTVERVHWDAFGNDASFLVEMSNDGGNTWFTIANVSGNERMFDWNVPNLITGQAKVRVSRGGITGVSDANFSILGRPENLRLTKVCPDAIRVEWDALPNAAAYDVFILGFQYMDSIGTTANTYFDIALPNSIGEHWVAVRGVGANGLRGRRTNAVRFAPTGLENCLFNNDLVLTQIVAPNGDVKDCSGTNYAVTVEITNNSIATKSNFAVSYDYNGNTVTETFADTLASLATATYTFSAPLSGLALGTHNLSAWVALANDDFTANDTTAATFNISAGTSASLPIIENFDAFATCPTTTNCGTTICALGNGWENASNDDHDWRVHTGTTTSANTGPAGDHTSGSGNYIYLESSSCLNSEAVLVSPCINLATATAPQLSFWYNGNGAETGSLHVDIYNGTTWITDVIAPIVGNQGTAWSQFFVNLLPYVGEVINVRFRGITGGGFTSDMALDDINISEVAVAPLANFNVTSGGACVGSAFTLTDASGNVPTAWSWTITPNTYTFLNGTTANSQNPVVAFSQIGNYDVQLLATNSNGADSITQSSVIAILPSVNMPLVEDFESGSFPPANFTIDNPDGSDTWQLSGAAIGANGNITQSYVVNNFSYNAPGQEDKLSVTVDLTNETVATLAFDVAHARYSATYADGFRVDVYTDCGENFVGSVYNKAGADLATAPNQTTAFTPNAAAQWRNETVDLSAFVGSIIRLDFVNVCDYGNNIYFDNININDTPINTGSTTFQAAFTASQGDFCVGQPVSVFDNSVGDSLVYTWNFGAGATPQTATGAGPHSFAYSTNGQKTVTLSLTGANGQSSTVTKNVFVQGNPTAAFNLVTLNDSTVRVFSGATFANFIAWNFGDGGSSSAQNPIYAYDSTGTFTITLTAYGDCGVVSNSQQVTTQLVSTQAITVVENISVFPNPNNGQFTVTIAGVSKDLNLKLLDVQGRVLQTWAYPNTVTDFRQALNIGQVAAGVYFLHVQTADNTQVIRLIIDN